MRPTDRKQELLGVNLLSRQGNSQAGYRMSDLLPGSYIPCPVSSKEELQIHKNRNKKSKKKTNRYKVEI